MKEGAKRMFNTISPDDFLFTSLLQQVLSDGFLEGVPGCSTRQALHDELATMAAFDVKGDRVRLKRWFSWCKEFPKLDRVWHARLLTLLFVGLASQVYKHVSDLPWWGLRKDGKTSIDPNFVEDSDADGEGPAEDK